MNYQERRKIEIENKNKLIKTFGNISNECGIYILTREERGYKFAYVGQAKHILSRLTEHLSGFQHIDFSLRKHGLFSMENQVGWKLYWLNCAQSELDEIEQRYTLIYANNGYQMRNKTAGGQGKGKFEIAETKPKKGYYDGLSAGYEKARKEIKKLFEKNLTYSIVGLPNKNKEKALKKFEEFIGENIDERR